MFASAPMYYIALRTAFYLEPVAMLPGIHYVSGALQVQHKFTAIKTVLGESFESRIEQQLLPAPIAQFRFSEEQTSYDNSHLPPWIPDLPGRPNLWKLPDVKSRHLVCIFTRSTDSSPTMLMKIARIEKTGR
jgi:hypothetical protein